MIHSVRIESENRLIVVVETQKDYEEALKYMVGTEYEVVPYDTMVQKVKGIGNLIIVTSETISL